jgi:amino acid transporter
MLKTEDSSLKRSISLFQAVMYGVGLILGAGIYVLIGDVAEIAGNAMWISFILAAIMAAFTGLSYAELSSMFPKSAAEYVFVKNAFRNNMVAFVTGWLIIFVAVASAAAVSLGFAAYFSVFFPQIDPLLITMVLIAGLSFVNYIGIKESMSMNVAFTLIELAGLAIIVFAAVIFGSPEANYYEMPPPAASSLLTSVGALASAAGLAFFAYFGFENLANLSEETKNASRVIPKALLISIVVTTAIYILVAISAVAIVGWEDLSSSNAPLGLAAEKVFGKGGIIAISAIALFATSNTVLMMLVSGSRIIFGMARGGSLPGALARVHQSRKTPWVGVVITMLLTVTIAGASMGSIQTVANVAVFGIFAVYALVNFALIWLRYKEPGRERPFRSPITIGRFPLLAGLGAVTSIAMLTQFNYNTMLAGVAAAATGLIAYLVQRHVAGRKASPSGVKPQ